MTNEQVTVQKEQRQKRTEQQSEEQVKRVRLRILPIWLRIILVLLLFAGMAAVGLIVGYAVIGDGSAKDVFTKETWQHMLDIMNVVEE